MAFLQLGPQNLGQDSLPEVSAGARLAQLRCNACHSRDDQPSPRGQVLDADGTLGLTPDCDLHR